jgi:excisionase family DNA binding protein
MATDRGVLTVKEVCDLLQLQQSTIYKLAKEGRISAFKIDSEWRFRTDLIMRCIAENTKGIPQCERSQRSHAAVAAVEGRSFR